MKINGTVERILFKNNQNGYTVFVFDTEDGDLTCSGYCFNVEVADELELEGDFVFHKKYGEQFAFTGYERERTMSGKGVYNFLKSGNIPHIKETLATRIIERFGDDTARILEEDPDRLLEVSGIGKKKLQDIKLALETEKASRSVMMGLAELGVYGSEAYKIYNVYKDAALDMVKNDPYGLIKRVKGFGFQRADAVAQKVGIGRDDPRRVKACINYVLYEASLEGHTFLYESELLTKVGELVDGELKDMGQIFTELVITNDIVRTPTVDGARIYSAMIHNVENECARYTADLITREKPPREGLEEILKSFFETTEINYDDEQRLAVETALSNNISIITGGPGTGKTTIVKAILQIAYAMELDIRLSAPTGRAAKRLEESSGGTAKTLHRLLNLRPKDDDDYDIFVDELNADIVLVDEMSMVDSFLYANLLNAIQENTSIILVGDSDQLPSVGCGNVLADLLKVDDIPKVRLSKIHRTLETSNIAICSGEIKSGRMPSFNEPNTDVFFIAQTDEDAFEKELLELVGKRLPKHYGFSAINDIQILSPTKKGRFGTDALNKILQEKLNRECEHVLTTDYAKFKLGDKVMQVSNNYEREIRYKYVERDETQGVFNGDIGIVTEVDGVNRTITVLFSDDYYSTYEEDELSELRLAYAVTVHKSQGSEFPAVIFIAWRSNYMLNNRNLLYTGVTRAKELLLVMGSRDTLAQMIRNINIKKRNTTLTEKIDEVLRLERQMSLM